MVRGRIFQYVTYVFTNISYDGRIFEYVTYALYTQYNNMIILLISEITKYVKQEI